MQNGIPSWITKGRVILVGYVVLVSAISFLLDSSSKASFKAPRFLGKNTRLGPSLLITPSDSSLQERVRLSSERRKLEGRYLNSDINQNSEISTDKTSLSPQLAEATVPFELEGEPDWMYLNQSAKVKIWFGTDGSAPEYAEVLAIVPSGKKWLALLRAADIKRTDFSSTKSPRTLRIERIAGQ